jgi:hypothetical protein
LAIGAIGSAFYYFDADSLPNSTPQFVKNSVQYGHDNVTNFAETVSSKACKTYYSLPFTPERPMNQDFLKLDYAKHQMAYFDGALEDPFLIDKFNEYMVTVRNLNAEPVAGPSLGLINLPESVANVPSPTGMLGTDPEVANQYFKPLTDLSGMQRDI